MTPHHSSAPTSAGIWAGSLTDLRHAFRLLWKSKGITATTLLTLGLGIGATTAIFSTVYSLMLKPLPYQEPERIVELYTSASKAGLHRMPANVPFYIDYSRNASSYDRLALWTFFYGLVGDKDSVVRIPGVRMTAEMFDILRIQPVVGSFFAKERNKPGADKVLVLTQSYWETQYGESPEVLGTDIRIDDEAYKVIGVAPRVLEAFDAMGRVSPGQIGLPRRSSKGERCLRDSSREADCSHTGQERGRPRMTVFADNVESARSRPVRNFLDVLGKNDSAATKNPPAKQVRQS